MATLKLGTTTAITESSGALTIASSTLTTPTIASMANCTFPAGHILYTGWDDYGTQTTIGTTETTIMSVSWTTKGANSRIEAKANLHLGAYQDIEGWWGGLTITTGSTPSTAYTSDHIQEAANSSSAGAIFNDDLGNTTGNNAYDTKDIYANATKTTSYGKGTEIVVGLWIRGANTVYINRCNGRASGNESGLCTLTVNEIAT